MTIPARTEGIQKRLPGMRGQTLGVRAPGQGIYEASTTPLHKVGDVMRLWGGRTFYYAHFVVDTAAGLLSAADKSVHDVVETDNKVVSGGNYTAAIGDKKVEITLASVTKDLYQHGTFHTTDDTGEGYCYLIKGNSATGSKISDDDPALNATTSFILELYDGLVIALDTTTDFAIVGNPFKNLRGATAATDMSVIGVTMLAMDVSDKEYAWIQTWGPATVLADGTIGMGDILTLSDGVTGAVQTQDAYTEQIVGYALDSPDDTGHVPVLLQLMP